MSTTIYMIGAGGHARVCAEIAEAAGWSVAGFVDVPRRPDETINGKPLPFRTLQDLHASRRHVNGGVFICASNNAERLKLYDAALAMDFSVPALVHPSAIVSPSATIGQGSVLMPGVIVNANTRIDRCCILNTACSVDHDSVLAEGAQISPGVHAGGGVRYGARCSVGTGTSIRPGITIGDDAVVGAGSVLVKNVPPHTMVFGNPARPAPRSLIGTAGGSAVRE